MAVIKKSEIKAMSEKEAKAKIAELEKAILEMHGEGKREKIAPLKKTIAQLKTKLSGGFEKPGEKPKEEKPKEEKPKEEKPKEEKPKEEKPKA